MTVEQQPSVEAQPSRLASARAGLTTAAREGLGFCRREKRWLVWMALFVVVWTAELYLVQARTLVYPNDTSARFAFWAPKIRLTLDLLFISILTVLLGRRWLAVLVVGAFFAYVGLVTYHQFFVRPLSLLTILNTWREASSLGDFAPSWIPPLATALLAGALIVELAALALSRPARLPRSSAWLAGAVLATGYVGLYLVANRIDPLDAIQQTRGVGRLGAIRGYLGPWWAEWHYLHDDQVLAQALERRELQYNRLTPIEADIPIHKRLVILQCESLDYNVLGYKVGGQEVTPFLNQLREHSMFYRVRALHFNGSADADFVALNAVAGSMHQNTYKIPGYPYENTTPQLLNRCGFETVSFHGFTGEFYERRGPFEKMGFNTINFQEELEGEYGLKSDRWGVLDRDVLSLSAQQLRTATTPTAHFIISLTTHTPYSQLPPQPDDLFPRPQSSVERYLNNMRYLDNCLRDYITSLGSGATLMIYADHPTEDGQGDFKPDRFGAREYIPCFFYDTDQNLALVQKTRDEPISKDGSLNLVDMINYLRAQIERTCGEHAAGAAAK